jgi:hypothetical protein
MSAINGLFSHLLWWRRNESVSFAHIGRICIHGEQKSVTPRERNSLQACLRVPTNDAFLYGLSLIMRPPCRHVICVVGVNKPTNEGSK